MSLGHVIVLSAAGLIVAVNYLRFRDVLYPAFIQAAVWMGILVLYFFYANILFPLSTLFFMIVVAGMALFSLGCFLATHRHRPVIGRLDHVDFQVKDWFMNVLVWLPLLGLPVFLFTSYQLSQEGPFESLYRNLRFTSSFFEETSGGGAWGVWAYLIPISFISVAIQILLERYRTRPVVFWVSVSVAASYSLLTSGRTFVLMLIILCVGVLLITRRVSAAKTSVVAAVAGLAVFFGLGLLVGKGGDVEAGVEVELESIWEIFVVYSLGSLPAFDAYLHMNIDWTWGQHVFRSFFAFLSELGFDVPVKPLVQEFALVPFPTNVYTVYQPYFTDFALAGIVLAPLGLGYLHGVVYRKATEGHLFSIIAYALLLYPLLFQFFQDQYFSLLSTWLQYLFLMVLFFYRMRVWRPAEAASGASPSSSSAIST